MLSYAFENLEIFQNKVPESFITNLEILKLFKSIQIFEINDVI